MLHILLGSSKMAAENRYLRWIRARGPELRAVIQCRSQTLEAVAVILLTGISAETIV